MLTIMQVACKILQVNNKIISKINDQGRRTGRTTTMMMFKTTRLVLLYVFEIFFSSRNLKLVVNITRQRAPTKFFVLVCDVSDNNHVTTSQ